MPSQNLTLRVDTRILIKARSLAARRGTSVTRLVTESIENMVKTADGYNLARRRARAFLMRGFPMGRTPRLSRDELHERR
jgi:hypothetical protein